MFETTTGAVELIYQSLIPKHLRSFMFHVHGQTVFYTGSSEQLVGIQWATLLAKGLIDRQSKE